MKICIVSAHRGDACLSLGVSLVRWARAGHRIRVVNCFTRSSYAPYSDADTVHANDRTSYVSAMREKEDKAFFRRVPNAELVDLRLKEASLRFRCEADAVVNLAWSEADPAIAKIAAALEKRVGANQVDLILLPMGVNRHIDHITAREAALAFAEAAPCGFYEDASFAAPESAEGDGNEMREEFARRIGWKLAPLLCRSGSDGAAMKRSYAQIYCSLLDEATVDVVARMHEQHGGERIWANERLVAAVDAEIPGWSES